MRDNIQTAVGTHAALRADLHVPRLLVDVATSEDPSRPEKYL